LRKAYLKGKLQVNLERGNRLAPSNARFLCVYHPLVKT